MAKVDFSYDEDIDALYIYDKSRKSDHSVEFSDEVIADIDMRGNISGLEILNASKEFDVAKEKLKEIRSAELSTLSKNGLVIGAAFVLMLAAHEKISSKLVVPARVKR